MRLFPPWLAGPPLAALCFAATFAACGGSTLSKGNPQPDSGGDDASTDDGGTDDGSPAEAAPVDTGPDVDHGMVSNHYPAPHPPMPQVVTGGGPTLSTPKVWLVFFNYMNSPHPYEAQIEQFARELAASPNYWGATTSEYGVGQLVYGGFTEITDEAPPQSITSQQIDSWVAQKVAAGTFGGAPDPHTIYTVVYPQSTVITMQGGFGGTSQSCSSFGGYHSDTSAGGTDVPYAVIPTCPMFGSLTGVDAVTGPISHEWIEASTDPYPQSQAAYSSVDADHLVWELVGGGGEVGDMCVQEPTAFFQPPELAADGGALYSVQRTWSNMLAMASHDPCAPDIANLPYFNSAPVLNDNVTLQFGGGIQTKGLKIAVGSSKTIEVDLFSDAPTGGPWSVQAQDVFAAAMMQPPTLKFSWDRTTGQNGEKLYLTVTVTGKTQFGASAFVIVSSLGVRYTLWPGLVIEQ